MAKILNSNIENMDVEEEPILLGKEMAESSNAVIMQSAEFNNKTLSESYCDNGKIGLYIKINYK